MALFRKGSRAEAVPEEAAEVPRRLAQELMPLTTVQGSFIRRPDGCSVGLVKLEGTNDSLFTRAQKAEEAEILHSILATVSHRASVVKLPRAIDSSANLVFIDSQVSELRAELSSGQHGRHREAAEVRLALLEGHVKPDAERVARLESRETHPTYLAIEFNPDVDDAMAMRDMRITVKMACDRDRPAHICDQEEVIEALQLFFTPDSVSPALARGREVPLPAEAPGGESGGWRSAGSRGGGAAWATR